MKILLPKTDKNLMKIQMLMNEHVKKYAVRLHLNKKTRCVLELDLSFHFVSLPFSPE